MSFIIYAVIVTIATVVGMVWILKTDVQSPWKCILGLILVMSYGLGLLLTFHISGMDFEGYMIPLAVVGHLLIQIVCVGITCLIYNIRMLQD